MLNRSTRSNKEKELVILSIGELAKLERTNRKDKKESAMVNPLILMRGEEGQLVDAEGHRRNEQGNRLDENGAVVAEPEGVDRHNLGVDRHQAQQRIPRRGMTLGDYNRPDQFYANRAAIRPPTFQRNDFELKPAFYTLVAQHPFHGLPNEHPMDHIERFEDLASSIKANGVSNDYLFCKLFPYSLAGDAAYWLKQLGPGSLTTWEDTKNAFLCNFFDDARSEELRMKISTFSQGPTEAFKAAWVRFKAYQRDCPHHGFTEVQLLGIFFRGVDWRYQMALDAASNGNFNTQYPENATILIENLASSNSTKNADLERKKKAGNMDGNQIAEVKAKLDSLHSILVGKKQVQFAAEVETFEPEEQEINYINGAGFQGQRFGNQQGYGSSYQKPFQRSYGSSSYQKPPAQDNEMKSMLEQILEGQQKMIVDFNGKIDALYTDLNGKFESLSTHVKQLDVQVAQTAGALKRQEGCLPGKTDTNPRHHVNVITTQGGRSLQTVQKMGLSAEEIEELEDFEAENRAAEPVSIDTSEGCRSTPIEIIENSTRHESKSTKLDTTVDTKKSSMPDAGVDRHQLGVDRHRSQILPETPKTSTIAEERVYKPKIPYPLLPKHLRPPISAEKLTAFNKRVERIPKEISFDEAYEKYPLCAFFQNSREDFEEMEELFNKARDTPSPMKQLLKIEDPGMFVVPCSIGGVEFEKSICDSGASVNLMSRDIAERLGIADIQPPNMTLEFANSSTTVPYGTIPDLLVRVGNCLVPADFQVVEVSKNSVMPFILGRPFMATVGAVVDMPNKRISFSNVDKGVFYKAVPTTGTSKHASCIAVIARDKMADTSQERPCDKSGADKVLGGNPIIITMETRKRAKVKKRVEGQRIKGDPQVTLIPQSCDGNSIEYKVKCKGTSKPFSKVRALFTSEMKEKGQDALKKSLGRVLKLKVSECGACFETSSHAAPAD